MDLQQIRNFLKLAEELHFWKTAEKMNITQSALSRQIQSLEEELGLVLFERNKRNVKLTPAGDFLRDKWAVMLDELKFIHLFAKKISDGETGTIKIAHPDSISSSLLPNLLGKISARFPELQIELVQLLYENEQEFIKEYKIDLAFTRDINRLANISSMRVNSDQLAMLVPDDHQYHTYTDITPHNLQNEKFILPIVDHSSSYRNIVQDFFDTMGCVPHTVYHSDFGSTILGLVAKSLGLSILPLSYIHHQTPGIRFIELPFSTDLYVNWRTDDQSPVLKNVLQVIEQMADSGR
ncbi:LysR family transcriptional regulator [Mucilaginibacter dorajii]|uniref:LysR substrate-binding domain-containing protein n=1 Tax=Mucilaginibacter dorajii TaxID=692994 RepID=A0ABP7P9X3_9SPHI|nr:LysR substrate-binding domain-containing protein [Mucilaginibacter dorajii]MCS3735200.1 DNA-binding transcriptional LysR family regulator [Mucilaginibacter dorajii]